MELMNENDGFFSGELECNEPTKVRFKVISRTFVSRIRGGVDQEIDVAETWDD